MEYRHRAVQLARPNLGAEELEAVRLVLESGWLTQGPRVAAFEDAVAGRVGARHAIAVSSGTAALHLSLLALDLGPGDEVIVPAYTWVATANAVLYAGAQPIFVDVEPTTGNIDASAIPESLSGRTRVVLPVHLFGLCADIDAIRAACPSDIRIVEDAACALGARQRESEAGTVGEIGCFSFHPRKSITTGEGGMIVTNDEALARAAREMRNHGLTTADPAVRGGPGPHYMPDVERLGYNYRMSDIHAAIGLAQLPKIDRFLAERAQWARWYHDALADIGWLKLPPLPNSGQSAWQAFVTTVSEDAPLARNEIMARLKAAGIETRPGTQAVTDLAYYRERFGIRAGKYPIATMLERQSLTLPLHNGMSADDYAHVARILHSL